MTRLFDRFGVAAALALAGAVCLIQATTMPVAAQRGGGSQAGAQEVATPRTASGHPELSGVWGGRGGGGGGPRPDERGNLTVLTKGRPCSRTQVAAGTCAPAVNFERDSGIQQRMTPNIPQYKPEHWERVQYLDREGTLEDPEFNCKPSGVPRMGPPSKIVQTATELIFLYQSGNTFRVVPIDGRPHDPVKSQDTTWYGDAVGHWEGDTMVVDVVGFNDESWLAWPGWFHSNNMHVIERFTRNGNALTWQATVEDPDVLLQPWKMDPRTVRLNPDPKATLTEDLPCEEHEGKHMVTKERGD
jgi:hypothetical protein